MPDNCGLEYQESVKLVAALSASGADACILNDFTKADVIARPSGLRDAKFVRIQMKTTRSHVVGKPGCWQFDHVKGYAGMLVCCITSGDCIRCWMYDGSYLDSIVPENIVITPQGKHDIAAIASGFKDIVSMIILRARMLIEENSPDLRTEFEARSEFRSPAHFIEFSRINEFKELFCEPRGWILNDPSGSSLPTDKMLSRDSGQSWTRVQFKCCSPRCGSSGYRGLLRKKYAGKKQAYDMGDNDEYIFMHVEEEWLDVWMLREEDLDGHHDGVKVLSMPGAKGTGCLTLHIPPELTCGNRFDRGTGISSRTLWTANYHTRVYV